MNKFSLKSFLFFLIPLLVYLSVIFYLSSLEYPPKTLKFSNADKWVHFFIYLPLPWLIFIPLRMATISFLRQKYFILGIMFSLLYAASDEWHQSFVPRRSMDFFDFLADSAGILLGAVLFRIYLNWRKYYD